MTVFLTPDGEPFYARHVLPAGRPPRHAELSRACCVGVADAWAQPPGQRRRAPRRRCASCTRRAPSARARPGRSTRSCSTRACRALRAAVRRARTAASTARRSFRRRWRSTSCCGTGRARGDEQALAMVSHTFQQMARGGIYDQVGGGFSRYSVDAQWLVPHFEKMLYDNALLVRLGAHLWQATRDAEFRRVDEETIGWVAREMTSPEGGFYSSLDADSEGHEGKFYVWDASEIDVAARRGRGAGARVLGRDARRELRGTQHAVRAARSGARSRKRTGVTEPSCARPSSARSASSTTRASERVRPGSRREDPRRLERADAARHRRGGARLRRRGLSRDGGAERRVPLHVARAGRPRVALVQGRRGAHRRLPRGSRRARRSARVALYELTFDAPWLDRARRAGDAVVAWFWDDETQAFFDTAVDHETLVTRPRDVTDNAMPSGTSLAVELLLDAGRPVRRAASTIARATLRAGDDRRADGAISHGVRACARRGGHGRARRGGGRRSSATPASAEFGALAEAVARQYVPSLVLAGGRGKAARGIALLDGRERGEVDGVRVPTSLVRRADERRERAGGTAAGVARLGVPVARQGDPCSASTDSPLPASNSCSRSSRVSHAPASRSRAGCPPPLGQ